MRTILERVRYGLRALKRRRRAEHDLEDELRFHIEAETDRNLRAGHSPQAARRRALVAFGSAERFREEARAARGTRWLEETVRWARNTPISTAATPVCP